MIIFGILAASVLLGGGLFILLNAVLNTPSKKTKKAVKLSNQPLEKKKLLEYVEPILRKLAKPVSRLLPLNSYRQKEMEDMLKDAELDFTPKEYIARSVCITLLIALVSIPFFFLSPVIGFLIIAIGIWMGYKEQDEVYSVVKERRQYIEAELPRFTQHIALAIRHDTNITGILEVYRPMAGKTFGKELEKTIADIHTSNVQEALKRLSRRINSSMLNEVVRGLCSVDQGIDQGNYFQLLAFTYRDRQNQLLKKEALKRPGKIASVSFLGCFAAGVQILVILGTQFVENMGIFNI